MAMISAVYILLAFFFFFNDTATTEIYTLSLHDALPISPRRFRQCASGAGLGHAALRRRDRKSTRLNSSHVAISYAVFCLKKKNKTEHPTLPKKKNKSEKTRSLSLTK